MATETETTSARGPGQAPILVTRLGGQQRMCPVGARVRVGRAPTLELVSANPLLRSQLTLVTVDAHLLPRPACPYCMDASFM